ncbi:protein-tyrosine phosphatase family protein [Halobacterium wangiae]|uniref:protein-tyrosine phosphatase family protein n=1 Tax=Halobacterium wangiae TaxID=2902623 RepID=UPI001E42CAC9|nr:dual specificity protein phosphatase family protein [Halobacterium wangiae]
MSHDSTSSNLFVRPFGYTAKRPVLRRIGDRDLFLGNALAADPACHDRSFDVVLSATGDEHPLTTHHCPLADGPGNDWAAFEAAADAACDLHGRDGSTLIHCEAGISRSSTLAATAIAAEEDRTFVDALHSVQDARPHAVPHPALHELAVVYLAARR